MTDLSVKRQSIFFQHLIALEFNIEAMTKEHKIVFDKQMFCLPNQKAFEVITRFLFGKLSEVSEKKYDLIWPLVDFKDRKNFQKSCFNYLSSIAQESEIRFPLVSTSVLSSYGDAFYKLYLAFSTHVILVSNKKYDTSMLRRSKYNPKLYEKYVEILQINTISSVEKFQKIIDMSSSHLDAYFKTAKKLVSYINKVKLSNATGDALLKETFKEVSLVIEDKDSLSELPTNFEKSEKTVEKLVLKNMEYQKKVEKMWKNLEKFYLKEDEMWGYLSSELDEDTVKPVLNGKNLNFSIPESLEKEFSQQNQARLTENGIILDIPRFLKMFILILEICLKTIKEGKFSETYIFQLLKKNASELKNCFNALHSLNILASEMTVEDKKNVECLLEDLILKNSINYEMDFSDEIPPHGGIDFQSFEKLTIFDENYEVLLEEEKEELTKLENDTSCLGPISLDHKPEFNQINDSFQDYQALSAVTDTFSNLKLSEESVFLSRTSESDVQKSVSPQKDTVGSRNKITESKFPYNESWLHEESLNSQTLPTHVFSDSD